MCTQKFISLQLYLNMHSPNKLKFDDLIRSPDDYRNEVKIK